MDFDLLFLCKLIFGTILGSILIDWFNRQKSKRDLCIQIYERWISSPLYENRNDVLKQLKSFFDKPPAIGCQWSDRKIKLSELKFLSQPSQNYQPQDFSKDFIDKFIQVMIFFADLNKLIKSGLINKQLLQILFKDTILPWYKYIDKLEFDQIEKIEYSFVVSEINSLKEMLNNPFPNEVSLLHLNYILLKQEYNRLKQELKTK